MPRSPVRSSHGQSPASVHSSHGVRHMQRPQCKPRAMTLAEIAAENDWKNDMVLWVLPRELRAAMPRIVNSWVSVSPGQQWWCVHRRVPAPHPVQIAANPASNPHAYHLYCAGPKLSNVLGPIRGCGSHLGVLHLRRGRGAAIPGAGAAVPQGYGAPSRRK